MNPLYHEHARAYRRAIEDNAYNALYERPSLLALLPVVEKKTVLDLGCGPGLYTRLLLDQGARVTAVDGSPEMVKLLHKELGDRAHAYVQDLAQGLPDEEDASYDLVLSPLTLHYIEDWQPLLRDVHRVLKGDGHFVFSTHHPLFDYEPDRSANYYATEAIEETWDTIGQPVAVEFYRRPLSAMFAALEQAGLRVERLTEGQPAPEMASSDPAAFARLSREPAFLFFRCIIHGGTN